jgi:hypothetical protein
VGIAEPGTYKVRATLKVFEGRELSAEQAVEVK